MKINVRAHPPRNILCTATLTLLLTASAAMATELPVVNLTVHQGRFSPEAVPVPADTAISATRLKTGHIPHPQSPSKPRTR